MKICALLALAPLLVLTNPLRTNTEDQAPPHSDGARIRAEVAEFLDTYLERLEGSDLEAVRGLFVDDARFAWFTDGAKAYASADDVVTALSDMGGMRFSTSVSDLDVVPLTPTFAHARSAFQTKIFQDATPVHDYGGVITWLLERSPAGDWRVLSGHTSTPKPR